MTTKRANFRRVRLALAAVATAFTVGAAAAPVGAAGGNGDMVAVCRQVVAMAPQDGAALDTNPPPDGTVRVGQKVEVTFRWDPRFFAGDQLRRVAHCVTVGGEPVGPASGMETPSANDGEYRATFTVPDAPPGTCFCVRGAASGEGPDGRMDSVGDVPACLTVVGPPTPPASGPPRPPAEVPPAAAPRPRVESSTVSQSPADQLVPATVAKPMPLQELPRTGAAEIRFLLLLAGLALVVGGGAVTARR